MTESSNNNYTAADFERYHAGKMSAAEMHALEKAAMDDPFLADALEGFVLTPSPQNDLELIRTKLFGEKKEEKTAPVIRRNFSWMKAAAIIIFIAGGTWLAFQVTNPKKTETDIAVQNKGDKKPATADTTPKIDFPTAITQSKQDTLNLATVASGSRNRQTTVSDSLSTKSFGAFLSDARDSFTITNNGSFVSQVPLAVGTDSVKFYSTQVDVAYNNNAVNMNASTPNNASAKMPLPGYNNTYKSAKRKDNEVESFMKESKGKTDSDTITNLNIVLQADKTDLNEVVVSTNKKQLAAESKFELKVDTLEPQDGWHKFDEYIARNIQVPDELKSKKESYSGEVELEFDINKKGEPVNITVTKSLCNKCDEEAIRLLKEGPKWKKKKAKKGKVTIRF